MTARPHLVVDRGRRPLWLLAAATTLTLTLTVTATACGCSTSSRSHQTSQTVDHTTTTSPSRASTPSASASNTTRPQPRGALVDDEAADPIRIDISRIGVSAPIIALGLDAAGTLEVPGDFSQTGWWTGGPEPGEQGPAVIAGHVDSTRGPAVFYRLHELQPGDVVTVHRADNTTVDFIVDRLEQHPKTAFPTDAVYGPTTGPELRLITCGGTFDPSTGHYLDNHVVYAQRL